MQPHQQKKETPITQQPLRLHLPGAPTQSPTLPATPTSTRQDAWIAAGVPGRDITGTKPVVAFQHTQVCGHEVYAALRACC